MIRFLAHSSSLDSSLVALRLFVLALALLIAPLAAGAQTAGKVWRVANHRTPILAFAASRRLPAMYPFREMVDDGGLMCYGPNLVENFRAVAGYVDKILKGATAGDLPIAQATKFDLVINLKTAKALGLTIPSLLLLQASEVIQ